MSMDDGAGDEDRVRAWGLHARSGRHSSTQDLSQLGRHVEGIDDDDLPAHQRAAEQRGDDLYAQHSVSGATGESLQREVLEKLRQERRKLKIREADARDQYTSHFSGAMIWLVAILMLYYVMRGQMNEMDSGGAKGGGQQLDHDWAD